ncbi:hypothetical protein QYE76_044089 [Lolium multiflorum]|uniref:Retrotransposon gag domain-containing protein n=1 Tax=Lolium multiflorum TaxID=4521 RepID=A0AAD8TIL1_LOLMU|nr:hypothetical protein QYE76_044089 [Lolium multiflorum]
MSVGSDNPVPSEMTSYYCLNCDTRHGLGSSDTPFICSAQYSSGEDGVDSIVKEGTWRTARHQVYAANNTGNARNGGGGEHTPRSSRRRSFENSDSNHSSDYIIAEEEWAAATAAVLNNTPLPAGTSVGTLNAYREILDKNREQLSIEQATLEKRLLAAEQSSERRRVSRGSASRSSQGVRKHRSRLSRLSEDDAREITSNLSRSFMTTDTAGMLRPKTVEGATANLAAYLVNQRPEGSMVQAHRGALESLAILGDKLVPRKEKASPQDGGSKHRSRDARDEITQSRIDKARRRRAAREYDSDASEESEEYDGELRGADCLSYKTRETMPPKKFKPAPTDAAKYDGQQGPRSWIDDYLQTVILHKGNQIAAMQCLQLYLKDSARAWLRGLPKGSIKSWDNLVDAFVANFQATYKRPVGIKELRHCQQKPKESMRAYIGRFTKLLNAAEDVSVDRVIDAFSNAIRRKTYIEELGSKKPKTITKLMEIANSWADGEENVRRPRQRSDDEDDDQPKNDSGGRRDRRKKRKDRYDDNNLVAAGYSDRQGDRADHPMTIPKPHAALVVEAQIGGFKMSKVFMDGGSGLNLIFLDTIKTMGITMRMLEETDCFHGILPTSPAYSIGKVYLNVVFGKPDNFRKEKIEFEVVNWESQYHAILGRSAYAKFMVVPHYAYLKLKMSGNNGTNITVYGSFSRSDNCDREFQKIAAKFGLSRSVDLPSKSSAHDNKKDERVKKMKKKPADLAIEVPTVKTSAADGTAVTEGNKNLAITARTPCEISDASKTADAVDKLEDKKNPPLV